jgi:hypothetical protein
MRQIFRHVIALTILIIAPGSLVVAACGDGGETCVDVSCDNHEPGSMKVYQKCCDQNEEGRTICAYVTSDGDRFQCDDLDCPEGADPVIAWCKQP